MHVDSPGCRVSCTLPSQLTSALLYSQCGGHLGFGSGVGKSQSIFLRAKPHVPGTRQHRWVTCARTQPIATLGSEKVVVGVEPERMDVAVRKEFIVVDSPGVAMVTAHLNEVESISRIDARAF